MYPYTRTEYELKRIRYYNTFLFLPTWCASSKRFGQARLAQNGICGVTTWNTDRHREIPLRDGTVPDFVTTTPLPNERATGGAQQVPQRAIKLRRHSTHNRFGFA